MRQTSRTFVTFVLLYISASALYSQLKPATLSLREITDGVQRRFSMTDNAIAEFDHSVLFGFSQIEQKFDGTLTMEKPRKYRIESEHQTVVTDGITVWAYAQATKQVLIDHYKEDQNSISPEHFLLNLPKNYYTSLLGAEAIRGYPTHVLKLVPKDDRSVVRSVKIWIEDDNWIVRKVEIEDANETVTTYTVRSVALNTQLRPSLFTFEAPPGVEVVDLR